MLFRTPGAVWDGSQYGLYPVTRRYNTASWSFFVQTQCPEDVETEHDRELLRRVPGVQEACRRHSLGIRVLDTSTTQYAAMHAAAWSRTNCGIAAHGSKDTKIQPQGLVDTKGSTSTATRPVQATVRDPSVSVGTFQNRLAWPLRKDEKCNPVLRLCRAWEG